MRRSFAAAVLILALTGLAAADDVADFKNGLDGVTRCAGSMIDDIGAGGDKKMAQTDMAELRSAWAELMQRFAGKPPLANNSATVGPLTNISMGLIATDLLVTMGRPDAAVHSLEALNNNLDTLAKAVLR
jgi:hypothetical protein